MTNCVYCRMPRGETANCACARCQENHQLAWDQILPPGSIYRTTDRARLKADHPNLVEAYGKIIKWKLEDPLGMVVFGSTGLGKTRVMWLLLKRLFDEGATVMAFSASDFADKVQVEWGLYNGPQWLATVEGSNVVLLDDWDKMVLTERVQSSLFNLIEKRVSMGRKILITSNTTSADYQERFRNSVGAALLRRVKEFCEPIYLERAGT